MTAFGLGLFSPNAGKPCSVRLNDLLGSWPRRTTRAGCQIVGGIPRWLPLKRLHAPEVPESLTQCECLVIGKCRSADRRRTGGPRRQSKEKCMKAEVGSDPRRRARTRPRWSGTGGALRWFAARQRTGGPGRTSNGTGSTCAYDGIEWITLKYEVLRLT